MICSRCGNSTSYDYCPRCKIDQDYDRKVAEIGVRQAAKAADEAAKQRRIAEETKRLTEQHIAKQEKEKETEKLRYKWEHRECPECAEMVKKKAKRCIHCQFEFTDRDSFVANMKEEEELANRFNCHPWEGRHALECYEEREKQRKIEEKKERERRQKRANELGCSVDELDEVEKRLAIQRDREARAKKLGCSLDSLDEVEHKIKQVEDAKNFIKQQKERIIKEKIGHLKHHDNYKKMIDNFEKMLDKVIDRIQKDGKDIQDPKVWDQYVNNHMIKEMAVLGLLIAASAALVIWFFLNYV